MIEKSIDVRSMIREVRGVNVILDRDMAKLLNIETRILNQSVKRNISMFNNTNYFQMNDDEFSFWKSQFVTSNSDKMGLRKAPYVFTKEGILILTSILKIKSEIVLNIIDVFNELENNNNLIIKEEENIKDLIYEIRGKQVILDFDLARLYKCKNGTKEINQAVKNNLEKFPDDYVFRLEEEEFKFLRSKILTSNVGRGGRTYLPYVFTEKGVIMLATILHTKVAVETSVQIVDTFVNMRRYISYVALPQNHINNLVLEDHSRINRLEKAFDEFKERKKITEIYFEGQIYGAYSKILQIFKSCKNELIIIDTHCGASINRIGYKTFVINLLEDKIIV